MRVFRRAVEKDIEKLMPLVFDYLSFYNVQVKEAEKNKYFDHFKLLLTDDSNGIIFLSEYNNTIEGFITLYFPLSTFRAGRNCLINDLYIIEGVRREKIGLNLMLNSMEYMYEKTGITTAYGQTSPELLNAHKLYDFITNTLEKIGIATVEKSLWQEYSVKVLNVDRAKLASKMLKLGQKIF